MAEQTSTLKIKAIDSTNLAFKQAAQNIEAFTARVTKAHRGVAASHKTAVDSIEETATRVGSTLNSLTGGLAGLGLKLGGVALGIEGLRESVKVFSSIDAQARSLAISLGKPLEKIQDLYEAVDKVARVAKVAPTDLRNAADELARALHGDVDATTEMLPGIAKFGAAIGDVNNATQFTIQAMQALKFEAHDLPAMADTIVKMAAGRRMTADQLAKTLTEVSPEMSRFGETGSAGVHRVGAMAETIAEKVGAEKAAALTKDIMDVTGTKKLEPKFREDGGGVDIVDRQRRGAERGEDPLITQIQATRDYLKNRAASEGFDPKNDQRFRYLTTLYKGEGAKEGFEALLRDTEKPGGQFVQMRDRKPAEEAGARDRAEALRTGGVTGDITQLGGAKEEAQEAVSGALYKGLNSVLRGIDIVRRPSEWGKSAPKFTPSVRDNSGNVITPQTKAAPGEWHPIRGNASDIPGMDAVLRPEAPGSATERTAKDQLAAIRDLRPTLRSLIGGVGGSSGPGAALGGDGGSRPGGAAGGQRGGSGVSPSTGGGAATPGGAHAVRAAKSDTSADAALIRKIAKEEGVDPDVAVAVAKSEGLGTSWAGGDKGSSFGPLQAHFGGVAPGMMSKGQGDVMASQGINARDPSQKEAVLRWQLKYAKKHGWGEWYGSARAGIGRRQGLDGPTNAPIETATPTRGGAPSAAQPSSAHPPMPPWTPDHQSQLEQLRELHRLAAKPIRTKVALDFDASRIRDRGEAHSRRQFNAEVKGGRYASFSSQGIA